MNVEPLWCEVRQHYCRCHEYGKRCDDFDDASPVVKETTTFEAITDIPGVVGFRVKNT